jgi:hypothetical protein
LKMPPVNSLSEAPSVSRMGHTEAAQDAKRKGMLMDSNETYGVAAFVQKNVCDPLVTGPRPPF